MGLVEVAKGYLKDKSMRELLIAAFIAEKKNTVTIGRTVLVYCPKEDRKEKKGEDSEALWFMGRVS